MRHGCGLVLMILLSVAALSHAADVPQTAPAIPDALKVPEGNVQILVATGRGDQIYTLTADAAGKLAWKLKAPEAILYAAYQEKEIGKHYAGPTWESADGSKVVGAKQAEAAMPDAIPWLLLKAQTHEGQGILSKVSYIQRLNTVGGVAPAVPANGKAGDEVRVKYSAEYIFFGPKP